MDATLIVIDSAAELTRARALVDLLWDSEDPADVAKLQAQARLVEIEREMAALVLDDAREHGGE